MPTSEECISEAEFPNWQPDATLCIDLWIKCQVCPNRMVRTLGRRENMTLICKGCNRLQEIPMTTGEFFEKAMGYALGRAKEK